MITYVKGDATKPQGDGAKIICHVCNDIGAWGAGFVIALSKLWKDPERMYKAWHKTLPQTDSDFMLGNVQFVQVEPDITVANMIGQRGIGKGKNGESPVRYDAIRSALQKVANKSLAEGMSVHAPRFGAGLAGGDWAEIEKIINEELDARGVAVTIYDFE